MLSWLASLASVGGDLRAAEGYLLELLAWCAFGEQAEQKAHASKLN